MIVTLAPGTTLGPYQLGERMGSGSFAEVWRADEPTRPGFTAAVALKILHPDKRGPEEVEALILEARRSAELDHPNVVDVRRIEQHGELVLLVMELVEGGNLSDLIRRTTAQELEVPRSVVLDIGVDIARALHHAWTGIRNDGSSFRIVHRDLKPANVMLSKTGEAKVTDFGQAKVAGEATATATGVLRGTPAYTPPEVWKGERAFGPATDLFSLGCILYELAMQRRLFGMQSIPALFGQIALGDPEQEMEPLRERFPELADVVAGLLRREMGERLQSAEPLIEQLTELRAQVGGETVGTFLAALDRLDGAGDATPAVRVPASDDPAWEALRRRLEEVEARDEPEPTIVEEPGPTKVEEPERAGARTPERPIVRTGSGLPRRRRPRLTWLAIGVTLLVAANAVLLQMLLTGDREGAGVVEPREPARSTLKGDQNKGRSDGELVEPGISGPGSEAPTPAPRPRPTPAPGPEGSPSVTGQTGAIPPTPAARATTRPPPGPRPTPAPKPRDGCLGLTSHPVGKLVWLDDEETSSTRARGAANPEAVRRPAGSIKVVMGSSSDGAPRSSISVTLSGGEGVLVHCTEQGCTHRAWGYENCR